MPADDDGKGIYWEKEKFIWPFERGTMLPVVVGVCLIRIRGLGLFLKSKIHGISQVGTS
jgi:hypothetical protein